MSNDNNLVRPAMVDLPAENAAGPPPPPPQANAQANNAPANSLNNLNAHVTQLVTEILRRHGRNILNDLINPGRDINNDVDQTIEGVANMNLADMDKIPDVVKSLRVFSGQPGEFSSWKKSVDRILKIYEHTRGSPKYYGILSVIRNKIVGDADIALESYNTPLNWPKISQCLTLHYADKRDIGTLEYQLTTLVQGNRTIPEFYQEVYHHLSLILNKLSCIEMSPESLNNMSQSYRDKALDTFVRGLKGDLPRLLSIKEPTNLPQALHLCLKLQNIDFRVQHAHTTRVFRPQVSPPIHIRKNNFHPQQSTPIPAPRNRFFPELVHNPQGFQKPNFYTNFQPQRPNNQFQASHRSPFPPRQPYGYLPPKPQPRAEPMDVDRSIHSRNVNYQNRPQFRQHIQKRPLSQQAHVPSKYQRVFHTEQTDQNYEQTEQNYEQTDQNYEQDTKDDIEDYEQTLTNEYDNPTIEQTEELDDIYFLDAPHYHTSNT